VKGRKEGMRGEGVKGREEGGRDWWGGSGDAGPSLLFVVGMFHCLGWCWAAVAVHCWCMWALIIVHLWYMLLPFFIGVCCCLGWYCADVIIHGGCLALWVVVVLCVRSLFMGG
jgi:hypothetical protein